ncbi:hypothetical protein FRC09_012607 [Ceratobasidium sp. 395]|nr:hypothetical protein FRC09_012607 [Ceratobasidium sp. 395]
MQHSAESLFNVAFLIPLGLTADSPFPPKFLLFMKSKDLYKDAGKFLCSRLPEELQDRVVWVHADMTQEFCKKALEDLRAGRIYGIVCTDVVGMGTDFSNIELVVQFQLLGKFCMLFQQFGRCVRSVAMVAIANLIVESKYFDDTKKRLEEQATKRQEWAARKRKANESLDVGLGDEVLEVKPKVAGGSSTSRAGSGKTANPPKSRHKQNPSNEEVMDAFINSHLRRTSTSRSGCRRVPGNQFFANPAVPQADPPPKAKRAPNQMHVPSEDSAQGSSIDQGLREALETWRDEEATARWGAHHMIGGRGILGNDQIKHIVPLACRGAIQTLENLKRHVPKWHFHDCYGPQILKPVLTAYPIQHKTQATQPPSTLSEAPPSGPALKKP